jgi:hypothetical protein
MQVTSMRGLEYCTYGLWSIFPVIHLAYYKGHIDWLQVPPLPLQQVTAHLTSARSTCALCACASVGSAWDAALDVAH